MSIIIYISLGLILLVVFGFILKRQAISKLTNQINFTLEYSNNFIQLLNEVFQNKRINDEKYIWLTERVYAMQRELGDTGLIQHYQDPLKGFAVSRYQLLINFLPEINLYLREIDNTIMMDRFNTSAQWCRDMFIRHVGELKEVIEKENELLFNPFSCLAETIRYILSLPFSVLYWLGILPETMLLRIKFSTLMRFIDAIIIVVGLVGSIFTILLGWHDFVELIKNFLTKLPLHI